MLEWSTACPDWEQRIVDGRSLIPFDPLFPAQAAAGLKTFNSLRLKDLPGAPALGTVTRPWMQHFVSHVFGAYDEDTGRRMISEFFMLISKKNTKSTSAAGIMMTALSRNWRDSAELIILAPTVEIANNSFYPARDMILSSDSLKKIYHVQDNIKQITHRAMGSFLKVIAADSDAVGGKKASWVLVDEVWLFGKNPKAGSMLSEAIGGLASRKEGAALYLTTQSEAPPQGVFKEKLEYARQVRDGDIIDNSFLPVMYEFPQAYIKQKLHRQQKYWYITNPNLGTSVDEVFLQRQMQKAEVAGEHEVVTFLAKHLNVEIGLALRQDRWAGADFWEAAGISPAKSFDDVLNKSEVVVCGIDGGGLDDLLGFFVIGREPKTGRWLGWAHAWAHRIVLERRKELAPVLLELQECGDVTIVDEPGQDVAELARYVCTIYNRGLFPDKHGIGVDSAGIGDVIEELTSEFNKIPMDLIIAISQGWRLNGAIKTVERRIAGKQFVHGNQRLMAFCVGSARTEVKANNTTITKQASGSAKIDPVMAMFDAASLMALNPAARPNFSSALLDVIIV